MRKNLAGNRSLEFVKDATPANLGTTARCRTAFQAVRPLMKTKNGRNDTPPRGLSLPKPGSACRENAQPGKAVLRPVDHRADQWNIYRSSRTAFQAVRPLMKTKNGRNDTPPQEA